MDSQEDSADALKELIARIRRGQADGVLLSVDRSSRKLRTTAIHWAPGVRNALAEQIIEDVHGPMPLCLDGHWYTIAPRESEEGTEGPDSDMDTGAPGLGTRA